MNNEDDFITRLMDETYSKVEHPSNELSNQNVHSLSDYFSKREDSLYEKKGVFKDFGSFWRLSLDDKSLDIPKKLGWMKEVSSSYVKVFEVTDKVLCEVLTELGGREVSYIEVDEKGSVDLRPLTCQKPNYPKAA